jgi:hypothetical protein
MITNYETKKIDTYFKSKTESYSFDEIKQITVYACPNFYKRGVRYMFFEDYHFAIIELKNNSKIVITCFMAFPLSNFIQQFEDIQTIYKKMFFPSIMLKKLSW